MIELKELIKCKKRPTKRAKERERESTLAGVVSASDVAFHSSVCSARKNQWQNE